MSFFVCRKRYDEIYMCCGIQMRRKCATNDAISYSHRTKQSRDTNTFHPLANKFFFPRYLTVEF